MKIVIEIPDEIKRFVDNTSFVEDERSLFTQSSSDRKKTLILFDILRAIRNSTQLKTGYWFNEDYYPFNYFRCSECDYVEEGKHNYCARCGAKMMPYKENKDEVSDSDR